MRERFGNRYYPVDASYDKRIYENSWLNIARIVGTLFAFWFFNALHWWGIFSLGIVESEILGWYSVGCFIFTVIFLGCLLFSGKFANKLKRQHEYYVDKIAEKRAEENELATKKEQEIKHRKKLEEQAAKALQKKREAEEMKQLKANVAAGAAKKEEQGFFQKVATTINEALDGDDEPRLIQPDSRQ